MELQEAPIGFHQKSLWDRCHWIVLPTAWSVLIHVLLLLEESPSILWSVGLQSSSSYMHEKMRIMNRTNFFSLWSMKRHARNCFLFICMCVPHLHFQQFFMVVRSNETCLDKLYNSTEWNKFQQSSIILSILAHPTASYTPLHPILSNVL